MKKIILSLLAIVTLGLAKEDIIVFHARTVCTDRKSL